MGILKKFKGANFFVFCIPFIQIGYTYYLSVQTLLAVYLIWNIGTRALKKSFLFACVVIPLMVIPNMYVSSLEDLGIHAVLISLREAVIFLITLGIITTKKISFDLNKKSIEILLYFFLIVVTVQAIGFTMGVVLFPPSQLLIENQDTLQGLHYAASLGLFHSIRTCAFYGEPSYLAFVTFSATFIILANPVYTLREKIKFLIIGSFIVIISRSLSGILAITILSSAFAWKQCSKKNVILFMLIIVILLLIVFFSTEFVDRVTPILSLDISNIDNSTAIRLIYPWNLIADTFQTYYLGGVSRDLIFKIYGTNIQGLDNGLFNLLINYGYLGVGVILLLFSVTIYYRGLFACLYLLLASMFNGSLFSIDKMIIIGIAFIMSQGFFPQKPVCYHFTISKKFHNPNLQPIRGSEQ